MKRIDLNCFVGTWPFHYVRNRTFADIRRLHEANGIDYAYISSTEAIFYQDPYEADVRLAQELKGSAYQHVVTLNPMMPGSVDTLLREIEEFPVAGVRILPGIHDYPLLNAKLDAVYEVMCKHHLPLFLTLRREDERAEYLIKSKGISSWDISQFVSTHTRVPIVICNCRNGELLWLADSLKYLPHVSVDCAGLKNDIFSIEAVHEAGAAQNLVYGSLAPLFCMKSTTLMVETADIPESLKRDIFEGKRFLRAMAALGREK